MPHPHPNPCSRSPTLPLLKIFLAFQEGIPPTFTQIAIATSSQLPSRLILVVPKLIVPVLTGKGILPFPLVALQLIAIVAKLHFIIELILSLVNILLVQIAVEHVQVVLLCLRQHVLQFVVAFVRLDLNRRGTLLLETKRLTTHVRDFTDVPGLVEVEGFTSCL